ncbi:hypothetical protein CHCC15139_2241 [Bacillus licheniformis]|nr:hypothetical protein CHCC15139_2241 [Bacillus licheniformis]
MNTILFAQIGQKHDFIRTTENGVRAYSRKGYSVFQSVITS